MNARDGRIDVLLLVTVAAAALLGGLLALLLLFLIGPVQPRIMMFVVVVVTLLAVLAVGTLQTSPRRGTRSRPYPQRPYYQGPPSAPRQPRVLPTPPHMYARQPNTPPRQSPSAHRPTFGPPTVAPQPPPDVRPPAYETWPLRGASAARVRRIVQCPECGDFEIDLRATGDELTFTCRNRGHRWTWSPGRPWPATVIRPTAAPVQDADRV